VFPPIPENTVRAARASYGKGNVYVRLGDHLNALVSKLDLKNPVLKREGNITIFLGLLTIIQHIEQLADVEMADSIQQRNDLKYALHSPVSGLRLDPAALCTFRQMVLADAEYRSFFEGVLIHLYPEIGPDETGKNVDAGRIIHSICENTIHKSILDAMFRSIEALSADHFNWLRKIAPPHWYERYARSTVKTDSIITIQQKELSQEEISEDIQHLLQEIHQSNSRELVELPEIQILNRMWELLPRYKSTNNCNDCINKVVERRSVIS